MGVWHFLSLGDSPGAVTAPLEYIKHRYEAHDAAFFGADERRPQPKKTSGIVLFTTSDIRHDKRHDSKQRFYYENLYGRNKGGHEISLNPGRGYLKTFQVVKDYIKKNYAATFAEEKGKVYFLEAKLFDLDFNIRQLARAFYALSPPGQTGREIWVNLTGGTNVMNLAVHMMTTLSGVAGHAYYTYTENTAFLFPDSPDSDKRFWHKVPVLKVDFDHRYEVLLKTVAEKQDWIDAEELLNLIGYKIYPPEVDTETRRKAFTPDYLNKLDSWFIERHNNSVRLSDSGRKLLLLLEQPELRALVLKEPLPNPIQLKDVFEEIPL
jgi:hypothetical protein